MEFFQSIAVYSPVGLVILRLALGIIFLYHGWMKFGMWKMQPSEQMPSSMLAIMKTLSIVETVVGIALILGFYAQIARSLQRLLCLARHTSRFSNGARNLPVMAGGNLISSYLPQVLPLSLQAPARYPCSD